MAIKPDSLFVGKIAAASTDYPLGSARNVTTSGDGRGTPFIADLVNDTFGFQQAILAEAGITPSQTPDTAVDSQYLGSLRALLAPFIASTTALISGASDSLPVGTVVVTGGYTSPGDGGGAQWVKTATTGTASQSPTQLVDGLLNDASGNQWGLVTSGDANVLFFGLVGDGVADDILPLDAATAYAGTFTRPKTVLIPSNLKCGISAQWLIPANIPVLAQGSRLVDLNGLTKSFIGTHVAAGAGAKKVFGDLVGFSSALYVESNASNIEFETINECTDGVVIAAITGSNLDNKVTGIQIGNCTSGIKFLQDGKRTQQGNEIRVNFVSNTLNCLVFSDGGTHIEASDWDSNYVETIAVDPFYLVGATMVKNETAYGVSNITHKVLSWAGGWNLDDNTMTLLEGGFLSSNFEWSFAAAIKSNMFDNKNYSSCTFKLLRRGFFSTAISASNTASLASFNSGLELTTNQNLIEITVGVTLAQGQTGVAFIHHALSSGSQNGGNFKSSVVGSSPIMCVAEQVTTEQSGLVRLHYTNLSSSNLVSGATFTVSLNSGD